MYLPALSHNWCETSASDIRALDPNHFKLVGKGSKKEPTRVHIGPIEIGGSEVVVMAGPCAIESRNQLLITAKTLKESGIRILRGGAFKPRTSPYDFQGLGEEGLKLLAEVKKEYGFFVITEALSPSLVELVSQYADILQIGSRSMQNFPLLKEAGKSKKPVLLKRGMMATLEELFLAAEYILAEGNPNVILCERGIRTFEKYTRNTLDLSAIPITKALTHLPIIVDPSHATGYRELVPYAAKAAVAAGADGLLLEVHPSPLEALSDAPQSLYLSDFQKLVNELELIAKAIGRSLR